MNDVTPDRQRQGSSLVAGIILIILGALLLALNLGLRFPLSLLDYWPMALIVPGIVAVTMPSRHLSRSGGIWLLATGLYCEIGVTQWFGLSWFSAWPIFIIAYGLDVIFDVNRTRSDQEIAEATGSRTTNPGTAGPGAANPAATGPAAARPTSEPAARTDDQSGGSGDGMAR